MGIDLGASAVFVTQETLDSGEIYPGPDQATGEEVPQGVDLELVRKTDTLPQPLEPSLRFPNGKKAVIPPGKKRSPGLHTETPLLIELQELTHTLLRDGIEIDRPRSALAFLSLGDGRGNEDRLPGLSLESHVVDYQPGGLADSQSCVAKKHYQEIILPPPGTLEIDGAKKLGDMLGLGNEPLSNSKTHSPTLPRISPTPSTTKANPTSTSFRAHSSDSTKDRRRPTGLS